MKLILPPAAKSQAAATSKVAGGGDRQVGHGLLLGALSGLAAISCCVSPVVLVLLGAASAAQAVTLGDTLRYDYGWWFRGFGIAVAMTPLSNLNTESEFNWLWDGILYGHSMLCPYRPVAFPSWPESPSPASPPSFVT